MSTQKELKRQAKLDAKRAKDPHGVWAREHFRENVGCWGRIYVFPDRIIRKNFGAPAECHDIALVESEVMVDGNIYSRGGMYGSVGLPGPFRIGAQRQRKVDDREVTMNITGPEFTWQIQRKGSSDLKYLRTLDANIALAARRREADIDRGDGEFVQYGAVANRTVEMKDHTKAWAWTFILALALIIFIIQLFV